MGPSGRSEIVTETWQAVLEGAVVLLAIFLGVRTGGIGLGLWGVAGTAVLIFVFGADPGVPPVDAFFIIIAVITASAVMQAAGGIDWLVSIASRIIRRNPHSGGLAASPLRPAIGPHLHATAPFLRLGLRIRSRLAPHGT
jgi:anaerobic C4-dicarboxylate transporter